MISIIVPAYNREKVIISTLESFKSQTFTEWECIVVDDHSSDNTLEVVRDYIRDDKRFQCISNTRKKGAQGARNTGIMAAHGDFIILFDSDDRMHSDFIEKVYKKICDDNADVCGSYLSLVDTSDNKIGSVKWKGYGYIHGDLIKGKTYFCNDSTIIRKEKLLAIGLLDEDCPSYQEWDTHIRLSRLSSYTTVEEELVDYYRGGDDTISKSNERAVKGVLYIIGKNKQEFLKSYPIALLRKSLWVFTMIIQEKKAGKEISALLNEYEKTVPGLFRLASKYLSFFISKRQRIIK